MTKTWIRSGWAKAILICAGLVPFALLVVGFFRGTLGANPVEEITNSTGTWALRFLLLTLAITPLRRLTGSNEWIVHRKALGLFAFFYGACHWLTYAWLDQAFVFSDIVVDIRKRPFILVGSTALFLMIPLAVTSTRRAVSMLGGKRWQLLHRLVYLSAAAGVVHYYWLVKADTRRPILYGVALAVLLGLRFVNPRT